MGVGRAEQQLRRRGAGRLHCRHRRATPTRRRPTTSSRTGYRTCKAGRSRRRRNGSPASRRQERRSSSSIRAAVRPSRSANQIAGKDNVLHLDIEPGTDIALFNGLFTYVVDQGWHDKEFIAQYTKDFDAASQANKLSLEETSQHHRHSRGKAAAGGRVGIQAEAGRTPSAHDARLRERHHLGQRQLPHPVGAGRSGARDA